MLSSVITTFCSLNILGCFWFIFYKSTQVIGDQKMAITDEILGISQLYGGNMLGLPSQSQRVSDSLVHLGITGSKTNPQS